MQGFSCVAGICFDAFSSAKCACAESAIRYCLDHIFDHFIVLCAKLVYF